MLSRVLRARWIVVGVLVALVGLGAIGKVTQAAGPYGYRAAEVAVGGAVYCWPVAVTEAEQERGFAGDGRPWYPLVYEYQQPRVALFWMKGTAIRLVGAWIGVNGKVLGTWRGAPYSREPVPSPGVVLGVIEYPPRWPVPRKGEMVRLLGPCHRVGAL